MYGGHLYGRVFPDQGLLLSRCVIDDNQGEHYQGGAEDNLQDGGIGVLGHQRADDTSGDGGQQQDADSFEVHHPLPEVIEAAEAGTEGLGQQARAYCLGRGHPHCQQEEGAEEESAA